MKETMGQIIKKLRKEHNFTQEELAEQLGVTFQAISKWENDSGMPDISQVIPIATVFGVSTDVLFGIYGTDNAKEVQKIIESAIALISEPVTTESMHCCYNALIDGLKKYPNNTILLSQCLETGISLAYPQNDIYDSKNGKSIYHECIRQADLIIKYGKNTTDIMRAHMIMVLLHAAYGNMESARKHAKEFPWRADMTINKMNAYISHFEKNYDAENIHYQHDIMYHIEAILDDIVGLGNCYYQLEDYKDARNTFTFALELIKLICSKEDVKPSLHYREQGDIYSLLAKVYLKEGKAKEALKSLKKMINHDISECSKYKSDMKMHTPLLRNTTNNYYAECPNIKQKLLDKLNDTAFDEIKENDDFLKFIATINMNKI